MSSSKIQTTKHAPTSPITFRSPPTAPSKPRLTLDQCMRRINDLKFRIVDIDHEQMQLVHDLSELTKACRLTQEESTTLVNGTSVLSPVIRLQHKNVSPLRCLYQEQNIDRGRGQRKEKRKNQLCANCGLTGHGLEHCVKQEADGFIHGCPRCNTTKHGFDSCIHEGGGDLFFLVKSRDGRPPIRTERDYRDITGFESMDERPWTPEFSRKHLNHHRTYNYKARDPQMTQIPDPAWLDEKQIPAGRLAYSSNSRGHGDAPYTQPRSNRLTTPIISVPSNILAANDSTNRVEETSTQDIAHDDQIGSVTLAVVPQTGESGDEIRRPRTKQRKFHTGKRRFFAACFRGIEV